jgi:hypothetical protein
VSLPRDRQDEGLMLTAPLASTLLAQSRVITSVV